MLKCFRGGTGVYFKNCDGEKNKEANRFSFSDVGALATCAMKPVAALRVDLGKKNAELLEAVKDVIKLTPEIEKLKSL